MTSVTRSEVAEDKIQAQQVNQYEVSTKPTAWRPPALQLPVFSIEKLEPFLKNTKDFSLDCFRAKASSLSEELKHFTDSLGSDGKLQKCFVEDSKEKAPDFSLEESVAEVKEYITKFSLERQAWDRLLLQYQSEVPSEEVPRGSTETRITEVKVDPAAYLGSSQKEVLNTKPDYQRIVQDQNQVFACMELVMDELQGSVKQLQAFMDESTQYLQKVSVQLKEKYGPIRFFTCSKTAQAPPTELIYHAVIRILSGILPHSNQLESPALQHFHCFRVTACMYPEECVKDIFCGDVQDA
ncbi:Kinetochore-associated protein DSN1 homolog [Apodemus speciosus]|uniref:Kinetochore-associated protein DSN1 homolog n=1 Tax=Apodemus speciosus TaxID=105296 RepID=A0ABQ0EJC7_APOSI